LALLGAKGVAYPGEGASGIYLAGLVERLGIGQPMKPKMRPKPAEDTVEVAARGEADMVIASRIVGVPGVEFVGLTPPKCRRCLMTPYGRRGCSGNARQPPSAKCSWSIKVASSR
jgi:hypothetical protein